MTLASWVHFGEEDLQGSSNQEQAGKDIRQRQKLLPDDLTYFFACGCMRPSSLGCKVKGSWPPAVVFA
jgi:hypothetical protein